MNPHPTPAAEELSWSDALLLGYPPMDAVHQEFVQTVQALRQASAADLPRCLDAVLSHLQQHFGDEDRWMRETEFPARDCHIDEHATVLQSVQEVRALLQQGDASECQRLAIELLRWFPGHADYLDSALAHWLTKQRFGGKPVVLRRDIASKAP